MGTRITFITECLDTQSDAKRILQLEKDFFEFKKVNGEYFDWHKHTFRDEKMTYFAGAFKKLDQEFYEWNAIVSIEVRVVWISDEGTHGYFPE